MSRKRGLGELEQLMLFALVALGDDAYGVPIRALLEKETGRAPSPGALHTGYERLERRGLVASRLGEATSRRGGRPKRYYRLTPLGARSLRDSYRRVTALATASRLSALEELAGGSGQ